MSLEHISNIRDSFSRAASTYQKAAEHQHSIANHLVDIFVYDQHPVQHNSMVVDLGSGTGFVSQAFERQTGAEHIMRLDLCESMLQQDAAFKMHGNFVCADLQRIPLKNNALDYCLSSYAFQWAHDYTHLFNELARVLKHKGCVYFSMPGQKTFEELENAWRSVDNSVHVHQFYHQDLILQAAQQAGFECLHFSQKQDVLNFQTQRAALNHIKHIGAHNLDQNRVKHLTGKTPYFAFSQAFKQQSKVPKAYSLSYHSYFFGFRLSK